MNRIGVSARDAFYICVKLGLFDKNIVRNVVDAVRNDRAKKSKRCARRIAAQQVNIRPAVVFVRLGGGDVAVFHVVIGVSVSVLAGIGNSRIQNNRVGCRLQPLFRHVVGKPIRTADVLQRNADILVVCSVGIHQVRRGDLADFFSGSIIQVDSVPGEYG